MIELLSQLWLIATIVSAVGAALISIYTWKTYGYIPAVRSLFACLALFTGLSCLEEIAAYIRSYGVAPTCFSSEGMIIGLIGRVIQAGGTILIFFFLVRSSSLASHGQAGDRQ